MSAGFHEGHDAPLRELGLRIAGTRLERIVARFRGELAAKGITRVRPLFYLSTEWGVPFETIAIAIPFYLADPKLEELHADRTGMVEGADEADILRYLRHEMGHAMNYAYKLYERPEWIAMFGAITQPYTEEYRPEPWNVQYVQHLPGWYAQKHPDEDWAETFAVWMTPGRDWRAEHAGRALAKLELCAKLVEETSGLDPLVDDTELDEDVSDVDYSLEDFYRELELEPPELPPGLDGALQSMFALRTRDKDTRAAASLIREHGRTIARSVYTWTGHFPEHTRALLLFLADRSESMNLAILKDHESRAMITFTAFITSLAMNYVHRGRYLP